MKLKTFDTTGKAAGDTEVAKNIAEMKISKRFLSDMIIRLDLNDRVATSHTKDRSERRGGGIKPWKQKGTGRARAGSSRSPIWRKGGITFGPRKNRNYSGKINKKELQKALAMALAYKSTEDKGMLVVDKLEVEPKTKNLVAFMAKLPVEKTQLIVTAKRDENVKRAASNLQSVAVATASSVRPKDVLVAGTVVVTADALKVLEMNLKGVK